MKRGDTKLLSPNGVCDYCGTDEPGGGHAYQRWSTVRVKKYTNIYNNNDVCTFVCCRFCYVRTLPSHKGTVNVSPDGNQLIIFKANGKQLERCRKVKVFRLCVGYLVEKQNFSPHMRDHAMKRYWDSKSVHRKRQVVGVQVLPNEVKDITVSISGELGSLDDVLGEELGIVQEEMKNVSRKRKHQDEAIVNDKKLQKKIYWEPYDDQVSNILFWNQDIFCGVSSTHCIGAFTKVPLYAGQCIGLYGGYMNKLTIKEVELLPVNRQDYLLPVIGHDDETLFINGENSVHFAPRINHRFGDHANIRFDSGAQVHCMVDISNATAENPVELFVDYGYAYWFDKLMKQDYTLVTIEKQLEIQKWLRVVVPNNKNLLTNHELVIYNAWHNSKIYMVI
jgi:hypothetical protein